MAITRPYIAQDWENGDIITKEKLTNIEDALEAIDAEVTGARGSGADAGTLGKRIDDLVMVQDTQPTSEANEIWVRSTGNGVQVPTYEEFEDLVENTVHLDEQTLTDTQKAQARNNISAASQADVVDLKSALDMITADKSLFGTNTINGYYLSRTNGELTSDANYKVSALIPVKGFTGATFWAGLEHDAAKSTIIGYNDNFGFIDFWAIPDGVESRTVTFNASVKYVRYSYPASYYGKITTVPDSIMKRVYWEESTTTSMSSAILGKRMNQQSMNTQATSANSTYELWFNSIKNPTIVLYGKIGSFGSIDIGHGSDGATYTQFLRIDNTDLTFYANGSAGTVLPHNLTLNTYIFVELKIEYNCDYSITVQTLGGTFQRSMRYPSCWTGQKGGIFVRCNNTVLTNFEFTYYAPFEKTKWGFGDSYLSNYSPARWPYYLTTYKYENVLLNAFPGENSKEAYNDWLNIKNNGTPNYLLWCLGMNDPDNEAVNADWLATIQRVLADCSELGITPILATIPNVPTINHTYKNAWIKASGYRYIDFAEAVGAEEAGSTWYDGCLETGSSRIHPTEEGAKLLFAKAITDFPELMQP